MFLDISTSLTPGIASRRARGGSYTPFRRPRQQRRVAPFGRRIQPAGHDNVVNAEGVVEIDVAGAELRQLSRRGNLLRFPRDVQPAVRRIGERGEFVTTGREIGEMQFGGAAAAIEHARPQIEVVRARSIGSPDHPRALSRIEKHHGIVLGLLPMPVRIDGIARRLDHCAEADLPAAGRGEKLAIPIDAHEGIAAVTIDAIAIVLVSAHAVPRDPE